MMVKTEILSVKTRCCVGETKNKHISLQQYRVEIDVSVE